MLTSRKTPGGIEPVMGRTITLAALAGVFTLAGAIASLAHDPTRPTPDVEIQVDGSGGLVLDYPFETTPCLRVRDTGFANVFNSADPGFIAGLDDPAAGLFEPALGTTVAIELLAIDPGIQLRIGSDTLSETLQTATLGTHDDPDPLASDLHSHGEYQLFLDTSNGRAFAEGRVSFRLFDEGTTYGPSASESLTLTNGFLPPVGAANKDTVKCTKAVAKEMAKLFQTTHSSLAKCLTAADSTNALATNATKAVKACSFDEADAKSLSSRILSARAKALSKIEKLCGTLDSSSAPYTLSGIEAHLDMARCRAEELVGASYNNGRDSITQALESELGGSACTASTCVGGIASGLTCTTDVDCATKTLVTNATVCMAEAASPE